MPLPDGDHVRIVRWLRQFGQCGSNDLVPICGCVLIQDRSIGAGMSDPSH